MTPDRIANPYLVGAGGLEARLPATVCRVLEHELGAELADLRTRARGVNPEVAYALMAVRQSAMSVVLPEEQDLAPSPEQVRPSEWLTTREAADLIGAKTTRAVVQAITRKRLPATRIGQTWRIKRVDALIYRDTRAA